MTFIEKIRTNPVRVYLYSASVAIMGVLTTIGVIKDHDVVEAVLTALPVLLAVPAVEAARAKVLPTTKLGAAPLELEPLPDDELHALQLDFMPEDAPEEGATEGP